MKLQDQCCTRDQGEKLEILGIIGKPIFCWCYINTSYEGDGILDIMPTGFELKLPDSATTWIAPAFTVAELGQMLPSQFDCYRLGDNNWKIGFHDVPYIIRSTEAECRASLLIHLLETNAITADEVNKRLTQ